MIEYRTDKHNAFTAFIRLLTLVVMLSGSMLASGQTQNSLWSDKDQVIIVVAGPYLELYVGPGRGYARFHAVEKNQRLRIIKVRTDWYKVETQDGKIGWVPRKALNHIKDAEGYPLSFPKETWKDAQKPWQFGLLSGELGNAISYSLYAGYRFTPNNSMELKYTQSFGDFSSSKLASVMVLHQPFPHWRLSPFFTLGSGRMNINTDAVLVEGEDQEDTAVTVGTGLHYYLSHRVIARFEYNHHTLLTTRETNLEVEEWKLGFSVLF